MLSSLRPSKNPAAVTDPPVERTSTMVTSQTEYSRGGGAKEQNQRGRSSAFARRNSSFYNVSYSPRLCRDCTSKCRLANVLIELVTVSPPSCLLSALFEPHLNLALETGSCQLLSACQARNRLARDVLSRSAWLRISGG